MDQQPQPAIDCRKPLSQWSYLPVFATYYDTHLNVAGIHCPVWSLLRAKSACGNQHSHSISFDLL